MQVDNRLHPEPEQLATFFGAEENGAFVMVNLLKFKERAEYPDGRDPGLSGREAYARYGKAIVACLEKVGGKPIYAGPVTGLMIGVVEDLWDMVALVRYPSLAAFQAMVNDPDYLAISVHRSAGLAGQLNIRTKAPVA